MHRHRRLDGQSGIRAAGYELHRDVSHCLIVIGRSGSDRAVRVTRHSDSRGAADSGRCLGSALCLSHYASRLQSHHAAGATTAHGRRSHQLRSAGHALRSQARPSDGGVVPCSSHHDAAAHIARLSPTRSRRATPRRTESIALQSERQADRGLGLDRRTPICACHGADVRRLSSANATDRPTRTISRLLSSSLVYPAAWSPKPRIDFACRYARTPPSSD